MPLLLLNGSEHWHNEGKYKGLYTPIRILYLIGGLPQKFWYVCSYIMVGQSRLIKFHLGLGDHFGLIGNMLCTLASYQGFSPSPLLCRYSYCLMAAFTLDKFVCFKTRGITYMYTLILQSLTQFPDCISL